MSLLSAQDVTVVIGGSTILSDVSFDLFEGEIVGLVGMSGSGKSMTGYTLMGLQPYDAIVSGIVTWEGQNLLDLEEQERRRHRGRSIAMIFQEPMLALNPLQTVGKQIAEAIQQVSRKPYIAQDDEQVTDLMRQVELDSAKIKPSAYPFELSGGQRQRVVLAIALAQKPRLLIADEPTTALDMITQAEIIALLKKIVRKRSMTLLIISHDLALVAGMADRLLMIDHGEIIEQGVTRKVLTNPDHSVTKSLIDAAFVDHVPELAPGAHIRSPIVLDVRNITLGYPCSRKYFWQPTENNIVVDAANLSLAIGQVVGIAGRSGCGKSSFLKGVMGLIKPLGGQVDLGEEQNVPGLLSKNFLRKVQLVFQDPIGSFNPDHKLETILREPLHLLNEMPEPEICRKLAIDCLRAVGLSSGLIDRYPDELSGGQRQRLGIARALMVDPEIILFDEAVSALDAINRSAILQLLRDLCAEKKISIVFVSHDISFLKKLCERIVIMHDGEFVDELNKKDDFAMTPDSHPVTAALMAAIPDVPASLVARHV